jgi:hypothetical protein
MVMLGAIVTVASYSAAMQRPGGGEYLIWYGPVIFGAGVALYGIVRLLRSLGL